MQDSKILRKIYMMLKEYFEEHKNNIEIPSATTANLKSTPEDIDKKIIDIIKCNDKYMDILEGRNILDRVMLVLFVGQKIFSKYEATAGDISKITKMLKREIEQSNVSGAMGNRKKMNANARYFSVNRKNYSLNMKGINHFEKRILKD